MITDIDGVRVGHWTDTDAMTGTTVIRFPEATVASGEVRGGAPATREFALLDPSMMVQHVNAVVLTGGSAFGLATADGVMDVLSREGVGFDTAGGVVPIVVAMAIYDLTTGDASVRPGAEHGKRAALAAIDGPHDVGLVGAGAGATVAKWRGAERRRPGGLVTATIAGPDGLAVSALIAVNSFGEPGIASGDVVDVDTAAAFENTTIGVVVTNAALTKTECHLVAQSAHDGLARAVAPSHTQADGDAFVAAATGQIDRDDDTTLATVRNMCVTATETAIGTLAHASTEEIKQPSATTRPPIP